MPRFRRMKTLQKFSAVHAAFHNHFNETEADNNAQIADLAEWKVLAA